MPQQSGAPHCPNTTNQQIHVVRCKELQQQATHVNNARMAI